MGTQQEVCLILAQGTKRMLSPRKSHLNRVLQNEQELTGGKEGEGTPEYLCGHGGAGQHSPEGLQRARGAQAHQYSGRREFKPQEDTFHTHLTGKSEV